MRQEFWQLAPTPPPAADLFATYQLTVEFRDELAYRQRHQAYCEWYAAAAAQHRRELESMRGDFNLFGWFLRRR